MVHGDIKPSNIHLGASDTVRLLDFGIAKTLRADCNATVHQFGSPSYCSPERLTRNEVDPQSDLWAVGATLYEMLAGVPPYQAEDTRKLEGLIRSKRPPRALPSSCPAGLRAIVMKALAPDARQRYGRPSSFRRTCSFSWSGSRHWRRSSGGRGGIPTATLEAAREALRRVTRTARRRHARAVCRCWARPHTSRPGCCSGSGAQSAGSRGRRGRARRRGPIVKAHARGKPRTVVYLASADRILDGYRTSADPWLYAFDWPKAEICLERAVQLGAGDDRTAGQAGVGSRLCDAGAPERGAVFRKCRGACCGSKRATSSCWLRSRRRRTPAPHLALARVYVYSLPDPEKAMAEFAAARTSGRNAGTPRGGAAGRRLPDLGAARRLRADWRQAMRDADVARGFYRRIPGFDEADQHLRELQRIHAPAPRKPSTAEVLIHMAVTRSWNPHGPGTAPVMVRVARRGTSLRFAWLVAASLAGGDRPVVRVPGEGAADVRRSRC